MTKITITDDFEQSYNELKSSLKEKYLNLLYTFVDQAREKAIEQSTAFIGDDIFKLTEETKELKRLVKIETKKYYKSSEYVDAQQKLITLKNQLSNCEESEKEELQKQISKSMAEIVTKNITIKNRLKAHSDKIKYNEDIINAKMQEIDEDIQRVKEEVMDFLRDKIAICIKYYNDELKDLNESFNMPQPKDTEIPFDSNVIKLDVPVFAFSQSESEDFDNFEEAVDKALVLVELGGMGHTSVLYTDTRKQDRVDYFAKKEGLTAHAKSAVIRVKE